tara:strand:- start:479798 stop:480295 length:498 start_codon:yes stop_codon:yes gene_type:complete
MFWRKNKKKNDIASAFDFPHADREERQHSLIGYGVIITGDIKFAGTLRFDGRLDGRVNVKPNKRGTLVVSKDAVINGPVEVTNLIVDGTINGNVTATGRIECRANGRVKGEVRYQKLNILDGGSVEGRCIQQDTVYQNEASVVSVVTGGSSNEPVKISSFLGKES